MEACSRQEPQSNGRDARIQAWRSLKRRVSNDYLPMRRRARMAWRRSLRRHWCIVGVRARRSSKRGGGGGGQAQTHTPRTSPHLRNIPQVTIRQGCHLGGSQGCKTTLMIIPSRTIACLWQEHRERRPTIFSPQSCQKDWCENALWSDHVGGGSKWSPPTCLTVFVASRVWYPDKLPWSITSLIKTRASFMFIPIYRCIFIVCIMVVRIILVYLLPVWAPDVKQKGYVMGLLLFSL